MEKLKALYNLHKVKLLVAALIAVIGYLGFVSYKIQKQKLQSNKSVVKASELEAKPLPIKEECPTLAPKIVLESNKDILKDKNWFVVDLDTFEITNVKEVGTQTATYYRRLGAENIYITVYKNKAK